MIEYALEDGDGNRFELSGATVAAPARRSVSPGDDQFLFENKVVPNSALFGSTKLGVTRIMSRQLSVTFSRAFPDCDDYRTAENTILEFLSRTENLLDITNGLRVPVVVVSYDLKYDSGSNKQSSDNEIILELLKPSWETTEFENESDSLGLDLNEININNQGYVKTYPIITLSAIAAVPQIQMYVLETQEGIEIVDALFGTLTYLTLVVNCKLGIITLSGGLDRTFTISAGTGFFSFPVGESSLMILPTAICDISVDWYEEYFI